MIDELKKCGLFKDFSEDELEAVSEIVEKSSILQAEKAFKEGEEGDSLIIIRMGTVRLTKKTKTNEEQELAVLGSGAYIGEMSIFDHGKRSASGVAMEKSDIFRVPFDKLNALLDGNTEMSAKFYKRMARGIARRLAFMNEDFTSLRTFLKSHE